MRPIESKITQLGNSAALTVPATLCKLFAWEAGTVLNVRLIEGGPRCERPLNEMFGGRTLGIIVTEEMLSAHGFNIGDEIMVPFHEWEVLSRIGRG